MKKLPHLNNGRVQITHYSVIDLIVFVRPGVVANRCIVFSLELVFQNQSGRNEIHFTAIGLLEINSVAVSLDNNPDNIGGNVTNSVPNLEH